MKKTLIVSMLGLALAGCVSSHNDPVRPAPPAASTQPWRPSTVPAPRPVVPPRADPRTDPGVNRPPPALEMTLHNLWRDFPGRTGISVQRIDGTWSLSHRGDETFPQQSVSKTWVALTLLSQVDAGRLHLSDRVTIGAQDLTLFHQPIAARVAREGQVEVSLGELLEQAIAGSDNSANDALLRRVGGPVAVNEFIERQHLGRIRFGPGERLLQSHAAGLEWRQSYSVGRAFQAAREGVPLALRRAALDRYLADPEDGASPTAITNALARLARGELLSPASTQLMLDTLSRTSSGPQRLRAGVPAGWRVAHKTGTGQELEGRATGYNDIAILTAPDGTRYSVAVMLASTTANVPQRMALMQAVSRAVAANHGL